jgi:hypothetical protein
MSIKRTPYSPKVILQLAIAGQTIALSQVGPDFFVLRDLPTVSQSSGNGRVDVIINNCVATSKTVFLPHGMEHGLKRVSYF